MTADISRLSPNAQPSIYRTKDCSFNEKNFCEGIPVDDLCDRVRKLCGDRSDNVALHTERLFFFALRCCDACMWFASLSQKFVSQFKMLSLRMFVARAHAVRDKQSTCSKKYRCGDHQTSNALEKRALSESTNQFQNSERLIFSESPQRSLVKQVRHISENKPLEKENHRPRLQASTGGIFFGATEKDYLATGSLARPML